jgi:hypothetical protein
VAGRIGAESGVDLVVERNPDTLSVAPDDMASPRAAVCRHDQHKDVGKPQRAIDLEGGPGRRNIANETINLAAAELDGSGLQHALTGRNSVVLHGCATLNPRAYTDLTRRPASLSAIFRKQPRQAEADSQIDGRDPRGDCKRDMHPEFPFWEQIGLLMSARNVFLES